MHLPSKEEQERHVKFGNFILGSYRSLISKSIESRNGVSVFKMVLGGGTMCDLNMRPRVVEVEVSHKSARADGLTKYAK